MDAFKTRIEELVTEHYFQERDRPLLLSHLGALIEKEDAWPMDRNDRNLRQLIEALPNSDLQIVRDPKSPAYIAVAPTSEVLRVNETIARRAKRLETPVRLEDIARPVLLAFCANVPAGSAVYVSRSRPFRYTTIPIEADRAFEWIHIEPQYRRPGLRIENLSSLNHEDRHDLATRIQNWCVSHDVRPEQFSRSPQNVFAENAPTALERLLAAQKPEILQALMIPADIAQILSRMK